jgi:hypothetical protein
MTRPAASAVAQSVRPRRRAGSAGPPARPAGRPTCPNRRAASSGPGGAGGAGGADGADGWRLRLNAAPVSPLRLGCEPFEPSSATMLLPLLPPRLSSHSQHWHRGAMAGGRASARRDRRAAGVRLGGAAGDRGPVIQECDSGCPPASHLHTPTQLHPAILRTARANVSDRFCHNLQIFNRLLRCGPYRYRICVLRQIIVLA